MKSDERSSPCNSSTIINGRTAILYLLSLDQIVFHCDFYRLSAKGHSSVAQSEHLNWVMLNTG